MSLPSLIAIALPLSTPIALMSCHHCPSPQHLMGENWQTSPPVVRWAMPAFLMTPDLGQMWSAERGRWRAWLGNPLGIPQNSVIIPILDIFLLEFWLEFYFSNCKTYSCQFRTRFQFFGILFRHRFFWLHAPEKVPTILYFARQNYIYVLAFQVKQVDVILAAWLFFTPKLHILVLWVDVKLAAWLFRLPKWHHTHFPSKSSRCNFGGMIILPAKITSTHFE